MKKHNYTTLLLIVAFFVGLSLLLYPTVSDYWNSLHQSRAIAIYADEMAELDAEENAELLQAAQAYNQRLPLQENKYALSPEQQSEYDSLLNVSNRGIMGYVEIPSIQCALPIYHGTDEAILQVAVGHLEWTSLPVGGEGSHCVISGHRGLPSAKLFTDLDRLVAGDVFMLCVLDEVLTYEVDQILVVEPQDTDALQIVPGRDYCTLVTCTPYGVNSHRLLVRGHRVDNREEARVVRVTADAIQIEPLIVAPVLAVPVLLLLLLVLLLQPRKKHRGVSYEDI